MIKVDKAALEEAYDIKASTTFEALISHNVSYHEGSVLQRIERHNDCVNFAKLDARDFYKSSKFKSEQAE